MKDIVEVKLWGTTIGHIGYKPNQTAVATFEYTGALLNSSIEVSPIKLPNSITTHSFPDISQRTFKGLPGIFADSLPDKFGNQLIDIYLAEKGIVESAITTLDRLLYVGNRAMGAIEYHPSESFTNNDIGSLSLDINRLSELANLAQKNKTELSGQLSDANTRTQALNFIRVSSSAGGARSKALVAIDKDKNLKDGTVDHGIDHTYWLLKFDSEENKDRDSADPKGMTKVEYIYSLIARQCDIDMPDTDYIANGDDFHFMIKRFDRIIRNNKIDKVHYASWSGLAHAHRDETGAYSYEQLVLLARQLNLGQDAITELFRRAVFNVIGRNQDDHTKNFGFLMNRAGEWSLAPAFDMTYSYDPTGQWTKTHQIKLAGKQSSFSIDDLVRFGKHCNLKPKQANGIIEQVTTAFAQFGQLAMDYDVSTNLISTIETNIIKLNGF
ncbi:type II toxin-antitoxin system HipA family toxin [Alteromonadaceae bacterium BrNp21-10]|nr:type II toxin-antitoxin system HipA family toxin [Alteromonadaceae bacterium BrNp21-10]